jgi:acid phosphatase
VDLLDTKGISWGEYQEHLPYPGYPGFNYTLSPKANDYVRKHNPLIIFDSIANNASRAAQIKNFTSFDDDLKAEKLPQCKILTLGKMACHDTNLKNQGHSSLQT